MKTIELTQGKVALVDDADFEWLSQWKWHAIKDYRREIWYASSGCRKNSMTMHRRIMGCIRGDQKEVDHRDGDGLNNQRANLRVATRLENGHNQLKFVNNTTGFMGVTRHSNSDKYFARLLVNGRRLHLGTFASAQAAAEARDCAAREHYGEFARLNFPQS